MNFDFAQLISQLKGNKYRRIGSGSCRNVYDLENGYVVKVAKDVRGILQNQIEHKSYLTHKSVFFAEVAAISENYRYLIMVKAKRITDIRIVLRYYKVKSFDELMKNPLLEEDLENHNIGSGDLKRASSWGIVNDVPVLIDYGLNQSTYNKYYRNKLFGRFRRLNYTS
ncbi:hypothetical protein [Ruminiclostridium cellulolyticum]|uniref:Uncharacterized protein n=1 Tax=Ruminiclostridium cellulolyticum (strain ATCC 35319 / DSM 5812 / JCM 6584 / H10) TaxID=394503 RepID=B8I361_RUMCH|nr:hypothetical protein [Ruminiclostridium cellulolyticum]ACL76204.1 conserved hypothetical protein [Ruminiclostridium cellulolyticum H10]